MFQKKCDQCGEDFSARRRIDCYCSGNCRKEGSARKMRQRAAEGRKAHPDQYLKSLKEWRDANAERARQAVIRWHKANPEKRKEHRAAWRTKHDAQVKKSKAEWHKRDPDRGKVYQHRRRAMKLTNGGSYTTAEWRSLKEKYEFRCLCCHKTEPEIKLTVDHVVPLTRGGANNISNIQPLCRQCNLSKHTRTIDYRPE